MNLLLALPIILIQFGNPSGELQAVYIKDKIPDTAYAISIVATNTDIDGLCSIFVGMQGTHESMEPSHAFSDPYFFPVKSFIFNGQVPHDVKIEATLIIPENWDGYLCYRGEDDDDSMLSISITDVFTIGASRRIGEQPLKEE